MVQILQLLDESIIMESNSKKLVSLFELLSVFEVFMNALYSLIAKEALSKRLDELSKCLNIPARPLDAEGNHLE